MFNTTFNLSTLNGSKCGFMINGIAAFDYQASPVSSARRQRRCGIG